MFKVFHILSMRLHKSEMCAYRRTLPKSPLFTKASAQKLMDNFIVT